MDKIGVVYEQARNCPCGEGRAIATYRVQGRDILSPRAYDKESAQHLANAYNKIEELKNVAEVNAQLANDRAAIIANLQSALIEIVTKHVPALLRDAHEADKTDCNAQSIRGVIIRALPGRNFP